MKELKVRVRQDGSILLEGMSTYEIVYLDREKSPYQLTQLTYVENDIVADTTAPRGSFVYVVLKDSEDEVSSKEDLETMAEVDSNSNLEKFEDKEEAPMNSLFGAITSYFDSKPDIPEKIKKIETTKVVLRPEGLDQKKALFLGSADYTRSISILEVLLDLEEKKGPLYKNFDVTIGMGQSSIICALINVATPVKEILDWWMNSWGSVFSNDFLSFLKRRFYRFPRGFLRKGYSMDEAKKELRKVLTRDRECKIPYVFQDMHNDIYMPAVDANRDYFPYMKNTTPDLPIIDALMDVAINPLYFYPSHTVKNKSLYLGKITRQFDMNVLFNNQKMEITSVVAPPRQFVHSKSLDGAQRGEQSMIFQDLFDEVVYNLTKDYYDKGQYKQNEHKVDYYETERIDLPRQHSTRQYAKDLAIKSGKKYNYKRYA